MTPTTRSRPAFRSLALRALHVVVPVILIAVTLVIVGVQDVLVRLGSAEPGWSLAALIACTAQLLLSSARWRVTAKSLGADISHKVAVAEYYLSSVINTTVPGGVVGDAVRAIRSRRASGFETAAQAVVIERLAGQVALLGVFAFGLVLTGRPDLQGAGVIAFFLLAGLGAMVWGIGRHSTAQRVSGVARRFLEAVRVCWFDWRAAPVQILLSLLIVVANLAAFAFAARAVGTVLDVADVLFAVPLILLAMLIPLSVSGWGYREGAAAAVFPMIGASAVEGVSASVIFGAVVLVSSLPGLAVVFIRQGRSDDPVDTECPPHRTPAA